MSEPFTIICAPADGACVVGSMEEHCDECRRAIWLAPSGQLRRDQHAAQGVRLLCLSCGWQAIRDDPSPEFVPIGDDQIAEIHRHFRDDYDDA